MLHVLVQAALAGQLAAAAVAAEPPACKRPAAELFADGVKIVKVVHVFTGPDGESHIEDTTLAGQTHRLTGIPAAFEQTVLGPSTKVSLVSGPGGVKLPTHPSARSLYLEIAGSSFVTVPDGQERELTPGTLAIFDDAASKIGHGGRTGPCGYVAVALAPAAEAAPLAAH